MLGGRILVNWLRKLFRLKVLVTSTGKHIFGQVDGTFCNKLKKDDQIYACCKGKSCNTVPRSSRYPAILGLITSFSSLYFYFSLYSTILSCSSESPSASSLLLAEEISTSLDHLGGCSNDLGLMPLTFWVQELALVVRDERPFLHQHCKRLLVCFQYLYFKVIWEVLAVGLSTMRIHQMFEKCWLCS